MLPPTVLLAVGALLAGHGAVPCSASCGRIIAAAPYRRCSAPQAISDLEWRRQQAESAYEGRVEPTKSSAPAAGGVSGSCVDDIDFFGGTGGGGTLTREGIANCQKMTSPALDAMEALEMAVKAAGDLSPTEAIRQLQRLIGEAFEANVSVESNSMKKAASLLAALEAADNGTDDDDPKADALNAKLDMLFSDDYGSFPDLEDEE